MGEFVQFIGSVLEAVDRAVGLNQPGWRILSLIVSPIVTLMAFYLNLRSRRELKQQAEDLGTLQERVNAGQEKLAAEGRLLAAKDAEVKDKAAEIEKLQHDISLLTERSHQLWKLRPAAPFDEFKTWQRDPRCARVVAFGNLKGGVGKTTLAANFGAYVEHDLKLPVLFVDLDFQASLSNLLIQACADSETTEIEIESRIDRCFADRPELTSLQEATLQLAPKLARGWLIPSSYQFAQFENQLLMRQLLLEQVGLDVRYRLAHALLRPQISRSYRVIIFDLPPRMSLGAINALIASHYLVVPTILDKLSSEAVDQFLANMRAIREDLSLDLQLAGIIGTMSQGADLKASEQRIWDMLESAGHSWRNGEDFRVSPTIRRAAAISKAAGEDLAYLSGGSDGATARELFQPVFKKLADRIGILSRH
jgi:cellulose biosynthesis protein BcsQ